MSDVVVGLVALASAVLGALVGRRQRKAGAELTAAQADEITERIYGRIVERLQAEVERLTAQVGSLETKVALFAEALRDRTAELDRVTAERDQAVAGLADLRAQLQARTDQLVELRATTCRTCPLRTP